LLLRYSGGASSERTLSYGIINMVIEKHVGAGSPENCLTIIRDQEKKDTSFYCRCPEK
jgi:hypothetical protein